MSGSNRSWFHKHPMVVFLILSNGITWVCWIPAIIIGTRQGYILPTINTYATIIQTGFVNSQHLFVSIAFFLGVYGPLIGALVATWLAEGKEGLFELWGRIIRWRVGARWYIIILMIAFLLPAIPVGIAALTGLSELTLGSVIGFPYAIFLFLAQILTSGLGEEPGWRGFLLPRLQAKFEGQKYIWVLGFIWAFWHYPFTVYQTISMMQDVTPIQIALTLVIALAGNTISLIAMTFIYVWVYSNTRSVFLVILLHALGNLFNFTIVSLLAEQQFVAQFLGLMPWVLVFILQRVLGKERFPVQVVNT